MNQHQYTEQITRERIAARRHLRNLVYNTRRDLGLPTAGIDDRIPLTTDDYEHAVLIRQAFEVIGDGLGGINAGLRRFYSTMIETTESFTKIWSLTR